MKGRWLVACTVSAIFSTTACKPEQRGVIMPTLGVVAGAIYAGACTTCSRDVAYEAPLTGLVLAGVSWGFVELMRIYVEVKVEEKRDERRERDELLESMQRDREWARKEEELNRREWDEYHRNEDMLSRALRGECPGCPSVGELQTRLDTFLETRAEAARQWRKDQQELRAQRAQEERQRAQEAKDRDAAPTTGGASATGGSAAGGIQLTRTCPSDTRWDGGQCVPIPKPTPPPARPTPPPPRPAGPQCPPGQYYEPCWNKCTTPRNFKPVC